MYADKLNERKKNEELRELLGLEPVSLDTAVLMELGVRHNATSISHLGHPRSPRSLTRQD